MGHRHDDNTNGGANEVRHLPNPFDDWDEHANDRLLAKIESENPLHESIEEEEEDVALNEYCNPNNILRRKSTTAGIASTETSAKTIIDQTNPTLLAEDHQAAINNINKISIHTNEAGSIKIEKFALRPDGHFDHVFERKIKDKLRLLLNQHVKSEQIDCNDKSTYTGLPGISLLYHYLSTNQSLDTKFREELTAKATHHVNQYLISIQTAHMHNSKCLSFLCGDLGVYTFCALARNEQRLHREMLTRTLSYPGPGHTLSQSAPTTPGVLGAELAKSGHTNHHQHQLHHHHHHHQPLPFSGVEQINSEPDTAVLLEKILELIKMQEQSGTPDELLYGRTGGLYAMLLIKQHLPKQTIIKDEHIINHISLMLKSGQTMESFGRPLFYSWHGKEYVGAAHGYAGILYMLLEAHKYLNSDQLKLIREAINFIQGIKYPSCNYPSSIGSQTDRLVHWCHGAPGVIHMLIKAYIVYKDPSYLESALACGDVIWQRGLLKKGFSLCHGISGNAYAFLHLYQLTHDLKHLYRAGKFAQYYFDYADSISWRADSPASLFEGYAGLAYFLADLLNPIEAKFPAFQVTTSSGGPERA